MLDFSGEPILVSDFPVAASEDLLEAFSAVVEFPELLSEAAELFVVLSLFLEELELLSPAQPVKRERAARTDTIFNLLFIIIHLKITFQSCFL